MCRTTAPTAPPPKCCKAARNAVLVSKRRRARKSVRISVEHNQVSFRQASTEDRRSSWYDIKDYEDFKRDRAATVRAFRKADCNLAALDKNQSLRGLEMYATDTVMKFRATGIKTTIRGVLQQQRVQRQLGQKDDGTLGMISMFYSEKATNFASSMAKIDAQSC